MFFATSTPATVAACLTAWLFCALVALLLRDTRTASFAALPTVLYSRTVSGFWALGLGGHFPLIRAPYLQGRELELPPEAFLELLELARGFFGQRPSESRGPYLQGRFPADFNGEPPGIAVARGLTGLNGF
jgi:hypothetical protein